MKDKVFKIKDSVDLFLSDNKYIVAYFMNSRQRKTFLVNDLMIHFFETIDGVKTISEIEDELHSNYDVDADSVEIVIKSLLNNKIITEVLTDTHVLSSAEQYRYTRQINYFTEFLGGEYEGLLAQRKVMNSRVVIFGCGAIGGGIAIELAMAGIGSFLLFDDDIVEQSDISRHIYFSKEHMGMNKVDALKAAILSINDKAIVEVMNAHMNPSDSIEELVRNSTFVINSLDDPYIGYTSAKISRICVKYKIPHFITGGFDAHLASTGELIIPYTTPCVECYAGYFKKTLKGWKPEKHPVSTRYMEIGGLSSMSLFSVSYASIEILKCIACLVDVEKHFKVRGELLFQTLELQYLNVKRNPDCIICGEGSTL